MMREGCQVAAEVVEYVLTCLHSHNPKISLEPVQLRIVEKEEKASRFVVQKIAKDLARFFSRGNESIDPTASDLATEDAGGDDTDNGVGSSRSSCGEE